MWREQWQPVSKKTLWSPTEADLQPWHAFSCWVSTATASQLTHHCSRAWHQQRLAWTRQWVCVFSAMSYHAWLSLLQTLTQKSSCWSSGMVPFYGLPDAMEGKSQRLRAEEGAGVIQGTSCKIYSVPTIGTSGNIPSSHRLFQSSTAERQGHEPIYTEKITKPPANSKGPADRKEAL